MNKLENITFYISKINPKDYSIINKKYKKKQKNTNLQYLVQDGIIRYNVTIKPHLRCQCTNKNIYCNHILYVLHWVLGLDIFSITFLDNIDIYKYFCSMKSIINVELENFIINKLKNTECGICLEFLLKDDVKTYDIKKWFICGRCKNVVHSRCMNLWLETCSKSNPEINRGCIYCKNYL